MSTKIDAEVIAGFTVSHLWSDYDNPQLIPPFHLEMWDLCCSDEPKVAIAAPRKHAKSSAITYAYILAMMLLRQKSFCLLVSNTESQASEFLVSIKTQLESNEALQEQYGIKGLLKDTETNIICELNDGYQFRIQAKGSEQKVRGIKWINKRPDLIVCDDLEEDEQVLSPERREKFRKWFMNALVPCGSDNVSIRVVGTILHLDSMLRRLIDNKEWKHLFYEAEDGNLKNLLWPEKFSAEDLRKIRQDFIEDGNAEGYSQEFRNQPVDIKSTFFNPDYFLDFERDSNGKARLPNLEYFAAADFAISEREKADYTAIVVCGMDPDGKMHVVDVRRFKGDADDIISELLATQKMWNPHCFTFESGQISKAIGPALNTAMAEKGVYLNIFPVTPVKSKTMRASSIQALHKAGQIRYDKEASWYPAFEAELLLVSNSGPRGKNDDMFDAFAYVGLSIDQYFEAQSDEDLEEDEWAEEYDKYHDLGRCEITGY